MTGFNLRGGGKFAAALLLGVALIATPALAGKGGNGGNGGGGGNSSHSGGNNGGNGGAQSKSGAQQGKSAASHKAGKTTDTTDTTDTAETAGTEDDASGNAFGNINGFLHASPKALAHASSKSVIGRVVSAYGAKLQSYLDAAPAEGDSGTDGEAAAPTAADLQAALQKVSNKPVTAEMIAAVNDKLIATNPALSASLANSGKTVDELDAEISAGL